MDSAAKIPPISEFYECFRSATNVLDGEPDYGISPFNEMSYYQLEETYDKTSPGPDQTVYSCPPAIIMPPFPAIPQYIPPPSYGSVVANRTTPLCEVERQLTDQSTYMHSEMLYYCISSNGQPQGDLHNRPPDQQITSITSLIPSGESEKVGEPKWKKRRRAKKQVFEESLSEDEDDDEDDSDSDDSQYTRNGSLKRRRTPTMAQRRAANIRERKRMYNLNAAFEQLRKRVPTFAYEKHLSRIETLKLAIGYINFMHDLLFEDPVEAHRKYANAAHEMTVKWSASV